MDAYFDPEFAGHVLLVMSIIWLPLVLGLGLFAIISMINDD